jgi:hypothetical protein
MRILALIVGLIIAAAGGALLYRSLFLEPSTTVVITETNVREFPNALRVAGGSVLLILGAGLAFLAARRKRT